MIHQTAIIDPKAKIADNVVIGPYSIIGADVEIDSGTVIGPHVVIKGPTKLGKDNRVFQFATIGEDCQDKKYAGEPTELVVGDRNVFREAVTVHRGTTQDEGVTRIGSDNLFMVNVHVAHDCVVGSHCILANDTNLAGHVHLGDYVILGGATQVHQFCHIGAHSMCGTGTVVLKDIPAYVMAQGNGAKPFSINVEGLKRRGYEKADISVLRKAYKAIYRQGLTVAEALDELKLLLKESVHVQLFIDSLERSSRGIIR